MFRPKIVRKVHGLVHRKLQKRKLRGRKLRGHSVDRYIFISPEMPVAPCIVNEVQMYIVYKNIH